MWEYRRVIPKHLWPNHPSHEFKRSTGSKKDAEQGLMPFIVQFKALLDCPGGLMQCRVNQGVEHPTRYLFDLAIT